MSMLVCLVEERSAAEMLQQLLPKMLPQGMPFQIIPFEGKQDLEKQLVRRIRFWSRQDACFLVMRDQDSGDCKKVKQQLQALVNQTGKQEKTLIRIACHELESFYLGDLAAVEQGLGLKGIARLQNKKLYKNPDMVSNAAEELKKLTQRQYQKLSGSKKISSHLSIDGSNRSVSFNVLVSGVKKMINH